MSVATRNPFAILGDESSSRPSSPGPDRKEPPTQTPPPRAQQQKSRGGPASRGGKYYSRGGGNKSAQREQTGPAGAEDSAPPEGQKRFDSRGRGRGGRGGNREGGNREGGYREGGRGGRRPFDKHSQTGKTDSDKKIHQGWGGDDGNAEFKAEEAATNDASAENAEASNDWSAAGNDWGAATADPGAPDPWGSAAAGESVPVPEGDKPEREGRPRREREPEEEDNTLTLDQYLAQKREKETSLVPKLESLRVANEGADSNIWKDVVPLQKNEQDEQAYFVGKTKSAPKARAKKEEKVFLEIDARFDRPERGRGRGRGGDRGRGRGGGRGGNPGRVGRQNGPELNVDDQTAFPSLS